MVSQYQPQRKQAPKVFFPPFSCSSMKVDFEGHLPTGADFLLGGCGVLCSVGTQIRFLCVAQRLPSGVAVGTWSRMYGSNTIGWQTRHDTSLGCLYSYLRELREVWFGEGGRWGGGGGGGGGGLEGQEELGGEWRYYSSSIVWGIVTTKSVRQWVGSV